MDTRVLKLDDVLKDRQRWCVPVYQRRYAWETGENGQLTKLWEDLREKAEDILESRPVFPHYIGAVIVSEPANQPFGTVRKRLLVDGQQRITTFQIVLAALKALAIGEGWHDVAPVIDAYLFNEKSASMTDPEVEYYKLWPSSFDRQLYKDVVTRPLAELPAIYPDSFYKNGNFKGGQSKFLAAFLYLVEQAGLFVTTADKDLDGSGREALSPRERFNAVLGGFLSGFRIVVIQLDENDDAQEIFASLNGLGKPLTSFDLIRNDVFHRARRAGEDDETLFEDHWRLFETPFWNETTRQGRFKKTRIDFFLGHVLVAETAKEINLGKLAPVYQAYARERKFDSIATEIRQITRYIPAYNALTAPLEGHAANDIGVFLRIWDITTFHPLILYIDVQDLPGTEKRALFGLIKAYIIRRDLCALTPKNYNNTVLRCLQRLKQNGTSVEVLTSLFAEMDGDATRMPSDSELIQRFSSRQLYNDMPSARIRYIMQHLEHALRTRFDESVMAIDNITIEHVMPRTWLTHWPLPDGRLATTTSPYEAIEQQVDTAMQTQIARRAQYINRIGNLTMVNGSLNPSLGNMGFIAKREQLAKSLLALNREIANQDAWDEDIIEARGVQLATKAAQLWAA